MGKGSDLWDDSALVSALDRAVATYKVKAMHSESYPGNSHKEEKATSDSNEVESVNAETLIRHIELSDDQYNVPKDATENQISCFENKAAGEGFQIQEESLGPSLCTTKSDPYSSSFPVTRGTEDSYPDQQKVNYNQLLKQYYELEEQRQNIIHQLQQANYWNYQTPYQSGEYIEHQAPANNASENGLIPPCSLCLCHCLASPLIPISGCATGGLSSGCYYCSPVSCSVSYAHQFSGCQYPVLGGISSLVTPCTVDSAKQSSQAEHEDKKVGMLSAERAISAMNTEVPPNSNVNKENEKGNDKEEITAEHERIAPEGVSQETDLAVVLNAWYSAGFHTGRYLYEQSWKKAHH